MNVCCDTHTLCCYLQSNSDVFEPILHGSICKYNSGICKNCPNHFVIHGSFKTSPLTMYSVLDYGCIFLVRSRDKIQFLAWQEKVNWLNDELCYDNHGLFNNEVHLNIPPEMPGADLEEKIIGFGSTTVEPGHTMGQSQVMDFGDSSLEFLL